ncbi:MAG: hypothetical protein ACM3PX_04720 [Omnitrophica WOR_2 bacterium]
MDKNKISKTHMKLKTLLFIPIFVGIISNAQAQLNSFTLSPSGTTDLFMKYVPKIVTYNGTNYITGYLTLSAYKTQATGVNYDPGNPFQKLQLQGGNILLCRSNATSNTPDLNPISRNGAVLFSDYVTSINNWTNGKWGIEYDNQFSSGGLNFFNPTSEISASRRNFNIFISNTGNVGIGLGTPQSKLHVNGELTVNSLLNPGRDKVVATDEIGKLVLIDASLLNDNMGNCIPNYNIQLGDMFLSYDGTSDGISLDKENNVLIKKGAYINNDLSLNGNTFLGGRIEGLSSTQEGLIIKGNSNINSPYIQLQAGSTDITQNFKSYVNRNSSHQFLIDNKIRMIIKYDQIVLGQAGQDPISLNVNGIINAKEIKVSTNSWSDCVFNENYKLSSLNDVRKFIFENNHLPGVPTASEVISNGINVGEMNVILLQKVEELTLYILQLQDQIYALKNAK